MVVYLAGADYKVREEKEVSQFDWETNPEQVQKDLKDFLIRKYGKHWHDKTKNEVFSEPTNVYKPRQYKVKDVTKKLIKGEKLTIKLVTGKKRIVLVNRYLRSGRVIVTSMRSPPMRYTQAMDAFLVRNTNVQRKFLAKAFFHEFKVKKSVYSLRDRQYRLLGKKR